MASMLERLVRNSRESVADGTYSRSHGLEGSGADLAGIVAGSGGRAIIAEVKFASPSAGEIRAGGDPASVARAMVAGGAAALSVLAQPRLFGGSPENLAAVRRAVGVPLLMKDVIVDEAQIRSAAGAGADYVLLIQSLAGLGVDVGGLAGCARDAGLGVVAEAHTEDEYDEARAGGADIVGINNRDLDTLEVDLGTTCRILGSRGKGGPVISESGISTPGDVRRLRGCGADGFLVGTGIMGGDVEGATRRLAGA